MDIEDKPKTTRKRQTKKSVETETRSLNDFVVVVSEKEEETVPPPVLLDPKEEILLFAVNNKYIVRFPRLAEQQRMYCAIHNNEKENYVMLFENDGKWSAKSSLNSGLRQKTKSYLTNLQAVLEWADEQLATDYKKNRKIQILKEFRQTR